MGKQTKSRNPQIVIRVERWVHSKIKSVAQREKRTMSGECEVLLIEALRARGEIGQEAN